jgi:hypothetical protein
MSDMDENIFKSQRHMDLYKEELEEIQSYQNLTPEQKKNDVRDLTLLNEKYNNLRKKIDEDALNFNDPVFKIQPISGTVWPGSQVECKLLFSPITAGEISQTAFCEIEGREMRLPLQLKVQLI